MANYTANYQLHQWAPEDNFLRTDFNTDFAKIDAALKSNADASAAQASAAQSAANRALAGLEPLNYNVYSLLLQNYYDSKTTASKRALRFDGFLDKTGISSLASVDYDGPNRSLLLDAAGQQTATQNLGAIGGQTLSEGNQKSQTWTATGNGTLTTFETYLEGTGTLVVSHGSTELARTTIAGNGKRTLCSASLSVSVRSR